MVGGRVGGVIVFGRVPEWLIFATEGFFSFSVHIATRYGSRGRQCHRCGLGGFGHGFVLSK